MTEADTIERVAGEAADRYLPSDASDARKLDVGAWDAFESLGFTSVTMPEKLGGGGGTMADAASIATAAGSLRIPLAESLFLAGPLLREGGIRCPAGSISAACAPFVTARKDGSVTRIFGHAERIPWAGEVRWLALLIGDGRHAALIEREAPEVAIEPGFNIAGEARDGIRLDGARAAELWELPPGQDWADRFQLLGAAARVAQIAGAAQRMLELTAQYSTERVQFGRSLNKFQAIQHRIAGLAADVASLRAARDLSAASIEDVTGGSWFGVACAKSEASMAAGRVATASHQIHGAIGFTKEHRLGGLSKRLWSWREEFGNELVWQRRLGQTFLGSSTDLWTFATSGE